MNRQQRPITDRELKAWLAAGPVDRGVGEGLTFVASTTAAQAGKASWILRFRLNGRFKEKVLGRYPELSLKDARELARQDRAQIERGVDVAAAKQAEKALLLEVPTVQRLGNVEGIYDRHDYFAERAAALGAWAALLAKVEKGKQTTDSTRLPQAAARRTRRTHAVTSP